MKCGIRIWRLMIMVGCVVAALTTVLYGADGYKINVGGPAVKPFQADGCIIKGDDGSLGVVHFTNGDPRGPRRFRGNRPAADSAVHRGGGEEYADWENREMVVVSTDGVANAAPAEVYLSERYGQFGLEFPRLVPGGKYIVRLHFSETWFNRGGRGVRQRRFGVSINDSTVLKEFDIYGEAGANKALVKDFTAVADSSGRIIVQMLNGSVQNPKLNGIEVIPVPVAGAVKDTGTKK